MRRRPNFLAIVAALLAASTSVGSAAQTAKQAIASRTFLIGTWHCSFTVGPQAGTYTTAWVDVLDDLWLKQTYDQPASATAPAFKAEYLVGYDERRQAWVRFGAMTTGQYFAIRMADTGNDGWAWKYVSFFKRRTAESPGSDAAFTKKSDSEYVVDGPTYQLGGSGPTATEHHICKKAGP